MPRKSKYKDLALLVRNDRVSFVHRGGQNIIVQNVQAVPIVSSPLLHPPPRRGGGQRWGFEPFDCAQDTLYAVIELLEQFEL
jgi:hypothetical protein